MRVFRRVLTKPVWWWERNRTYQIRFRHDKLSPIPVQHHPTLFAIMTTPAAFCDAIWAAWSWYRFVRQHCELAFVVDGECSAEDQAAAQRLFPGVTIRGSEAIVSGIRARHSTFDTIFRFHSLGRKLGVILALQSERPLLFSDHDVLAFNTPSELLEGVSSSTPRYMTEEAGGIFDPEIIQRARELGMPHATDLNSGLLFIPQNKLSVTSASRLLENWNPPMRSWFTEQTVLSVLLREAGGLPLSRSQYVITNRRQFVWDKDVDYSSITARHFTGTVRHVMYAKGMQFLAGNLA